MKIKNIAYRLKQLLLVSLFGIMITACEDTPPTDYIPVPFVEAYLIVDEPIRNIVVGISQPVTQAFNYEAMMDPSAEVVLSANGQDYVLAYTSAGGKGGYFLPDSSIKVAPETQYSIRIRTRDGKIVTANTVTPKRIGWIIPPRELLQYPQDTTELFSPDSLRISWTTGNSPEYLIRVNVLDTLGYGKYLEPETVEINERTNNISFEEPNDPQFYTKTRWGFIQATQAPTVWAAFRWYGKNEVAILAPDKALLDWFKSTQWGGRSVEYRKEYSNIIGGAGVFGSASIVVKEVFVLKRKK